MSSIPDWLVKRANDGVFALNVTDLKDEFNEILKGRDPNSIVDNDSRNRCCELLQSMQREIDYLSSLNLHKVIAKHVRKICKANKAEETIKNWVNLDLKSEELLELAEDVANTIRTYWETQTLPGAEVESKFSKPFSLKGIDIFHIGLENLIGYPPTHAEFLTSMRLEHDQEAFSTGRNRTVHPRVEWNIVMRSRDLNIPGAGYEPTIEITDRKCTQDLMFYVNKARKKFANASAVDDVLNAAEVAALRLWTGPMHEKYAEVFRNPQESNGSYVTTLHAINSGITKLSRIWTLPLNRKVYRGYKDLSMPELRNMKDKFNCVGGVETCVLATSEDFNIAVNYSGNEAFILEIDVGQVNRGADLRWLSQFPHEREILFNALSNVEFLRGAQERVVQFKDNKRGKVLVYQVCISANLKSKTLDDFMTLRKGLHVNLVEVLAQDAHQRISALEAGSPHCLIKRLCEECRKQCCAIVSEARRADISIFNNGTPEYVELVNHAFQFKSRSEYIIEIASGWFHDRKADPAAVGGLQLWQFEALRIAFQTSERPEVTTVVFEQDRPVSNLFGALPLKLGTLHNEDTVCNLAKLLSLNPELVSLEMKIASATLWERVFRELCPSRPRLLVNGFHVAEYAIGTLQQLELRNSGDEMAKMIAPALVVYAPFALTWLSLYGTPISCIGAESLGRAFTGLQRLKYLDLRSCQIADRGCTGIAQKLIELTELEDLKLARNKVSDDGFKILASTIHAHGLKRLKSVDMRFNNTQLPSSQCGVQCVMKNYIVSKLSTNAGVSCVAWSSGGDQIASGSDDKTIRIWDAKTGELISTLEHTASVTLMSVAWRPGGDQIASASFDKTAIIWDAKTGKQVSTLKGHTSKVTCLAWHPGGDQIVSGCGERIFGGPNDLIVWDAKTGDKISTLEGHTSAVTSVAWRPGGDQIVSGGYGGRERDAPGEIIIWNVKTGERVSTLKGHTAPVSVAWRPGYDQIASGGYGGGLDYQNPGEIIIWDATTGEQVSTLKGHKAAVTCVAWRPWGDQIASGSADKTIIIWDAKTGDQILTLKGHKREITSVAWRPGGDQIVSADYERDRPSFLSGKISGEIIIWDARTEDQVSTLKGHTQSVRSVAWCPVNDQVATASHDNTIIIWDVKTSEQVSTLKAHASYVNTLAWSPGGDQIVSGGYSNGFHWYPSQNPGELIIWDVKTGNRVLTLEGNTCEVTSVAWRPGGDQIVSVGHGAGIPPFLLDCPGEIIIWDAKTGEQVSVLKGHSKEVMGVTWRPGGDQIASGSADDTIIIWDAKTGEQVSRLKGHTGTVMSVAWRPGGDQIASGSDDGTVIIWDAKTGEQISTLKGHTRKVTSVAWRPGSPGHPGGDQIVSGGGRPPPSRWEAEGHGGGDGEVIVWDAKNGVVVSKLKGHSAMVTSVAWNPGGDQIASASGDGTVIIWDALAKTGDQVLTLN